MADKIPITRSNPDVVFVRYFVEGELEAKWRTKDETNFREVEEGIGSLKNIKVAIEKEGLTNDVKDIRGLCKVMIPNLEQQLKRIKPWDTAFGANLARAASEVSEYQVWFEMILKRLEESEKEVKRIAKEMKRRLEEEEALKTLEEEKRLTASRKPPLPELPSQKKQKPDGEEENKGCEDRQPSQKVINFCVAKAGESLEKDIESLRDCIGRFEKFYDQVDEPLKEEIAKHNRIAMQRLRCLGASVPKMTFNDSYEDVQFCPKCGVGDLFCTGDCEESYDPAKFLAYSDNVATMVKNSVNKMVQID